MKHTSHASAVVAVIKVLGFSIIGCLASSAQDAKNAPVPRQKEEAPLMKSAAPTVPQGRRIATNRPLPQGLTRRGLDLPRQGDYTYSTNATGQATITRFNDDYVGALSITNALGGCPVTGISDIAFSGCRKLTSVTIPASVTSIGHSMFSGCTNLTAIIVDASNPYYLSEDGVLFNKEKTSLIQCPDGKAGSYSIPPSVTNIESGAFGENKLTEVTVPAGVTDHLGLLGDFRSESLKTINVDSANPSYSSVNGVLFNKDKTAVIQYPKSKPGSYAVPNNVTRICSSAFRHCGGITDILVPSSVTNIGAFAFSGCGNLTNVSLSAGIKTIGFRAFEDCPRLAFIVIPSSVIDIGDFAFWKCNPSAINDHSGCLQKMERSQKVAQANTHMQHQEYEERQLHQTMTRMQGWSAGSKARVSGNFAYLEGTNDTVTITGFTGTNDTVVIPTMLEGKNVTAIGVNAFRDGKRLTSLTIPASVISIDMHAIVHGHCPSNLAVDISNPAYSSADGILFNKDKTVLVKCPDSKSGNYVIPASVTNIGPMAFEGAALSDVTIPNSVVCIGNSAFRYCHSLTNVLIGNNVTSIGESAFQNCSSLTSVSIPDRVSDIWGCAFRNCLALSRVRMGNSIKNIREVTFGDCVSLTDITVSTNLTSIGDAAFFDCLRLTDFAIPINVTNIGERAFSDCAKLAYVTIPDSVTSIGNRAFSGCTALTNVVIGASVTSIKDNAFLDCDGLTSVTIPNNVTTVGDSTFACCSGLTNILVEKTNPSYSSMNGILFNKNRSTLIQCPAGKIGSITIPNSVTNIGAAAFYRCTGLTNIVIPDNVSCIGHEAFEGCTNLPPSIQNRTLLQPKSDNPPELKRNGIIRTLTQGDYTYSTNATGQATITGFITNFSGALPITNTLGGCPVTCIGNKGFNDCTALTSVMIPSSVTNIVPYAFDNCIGLACIGVDPSNPSYSSRNGILFTKDLTKLILCPAGIGGNVTIPGSVTNILPYAFDNCTGLACIGVDPNNLSYSSTNGILFTKDLTKLIRYPAGKVGGVAIPGSVKHIFFDAFHNCTNLTDLIIPDGITSIGHNAFNGCTCLTNATIPSSITHIASAAFKNCTSLANITIPYGVINIMDGAFWNCSSLKALTIPDSVTHIGNAAFSGCTGLTSVIIASSVTSIGYHAFDKCSCLTNIYFKGDAPKASESLFGDTPVTIYYLPGTTGWGVTYCGRPTKAWPLPQAEIGKILAQNVKIRQEEINNRSFGAASRIPRSQPKARIQTELTHGDFSYTVNANDTNSVTITKYRGLDGILTIPSSIDGKTVKAIGSGVCRRVTTRKEGNVTVTEGDVGNGSTMTNVVIPACIMEVGEPFTGTAFIVDAANPNYCSEDGVLFNKDKTTLIKYPSINVENYVIPNSVTNIGPNAFDYSHLSSVTLPNGVVCIGAYAFRWCYQLTNAVIPNSVTSIGDGAFELCTKLTCANIPTSLTSIGNSVYYNCTSLTRVKIPLGVSNLGDGMFQGCTRLNDIVIPFGITNIGCAALSGCSGLTNIIIPASVSSIGGGAFERCSGLTNVIIPASVSSIGDDAFDRCKQLESIMVDVANRRFSSDRGVLFNKDRSKIIAYPEGKVGNYVIPWSVTQVVNDVKFGTTMSYGSKFWVRKGSVFQNRTKLTVIDVADTNPFFKGKDGILFNKSMTELIQCPQSKAGHYTVPNNVTQICAAAFANCAGITGITLPSSVVNIGQGSFALCVRLTEMIFPESVTNIEHWAFFRCTSLTNVIIPASVTHIDNDAFEGCANLPPNVLSLISSKQNHRPRETRSASHSGDIPAPSEKQNVPSSTSTTVKRTNNRAIAPGSSADQSYMERLRLRKNQEAQIQATKTAEGPNKTAP